MRFKVNVEISGNTVSYFLLYLIPISLSFTRKYLQEKWQGNSYVKLYSLFIYIPVLK